MGAYDQFIPASNPYDALIPEAKTESPYSAKNIVGAAVEPIVSLATGALAAPVSGIAGVSTAIANDLGLTKNQPGDVVRSVGNAMTYQPRTTGGQNAMKVIGAPFEKIAEGGDYAGEKVADVTGSPMLGALTNTAVQTVGPALIGKGIGKVGSVVKEPINAMLAKPAAEAAAKANINSVKDTTIREARAEGYVIPPSSDGSGGSFLGKRVEGVAGRAGLAQETNLRNQQVTNKIARREAGLADDAPVSEKTLEDARSVIAAPYREVAAISPKAAYALEQLKQVRSDAKEQWTFYNRNADPSVKRKAEALDEKAAMYERFIEKAAEKSGKEGLPDRVKEARTNLAKNYDVERALNVGSGDVDASAIGRMLDKRGVDGMSGGMLTIGKFAQTFGRYARENSMPPTPGKGEGVASVALAMAGHAAGLGWIPAGLPLLGGPARSLALSDSMQTPRAYPMPLAARLLGGASGDAGLAAILGASGQVAGANR